MYGSSTAELQVHFEKSAELRQEVMLFEAPNEGGGRGLRRGSGINAMA